MKFIGSSIQTDKTLETLNSTSLQSVAALKPSLKSADSNIISDGQFECTYKDIPIFFEHIHKTFLKKTIDIQDSIIFECENTVPSAIVLLFLLEKGYSFLLIPRESGTSNINLPVFCKYRIASEFADTNKTQLYPDFMLRITENDAWKKTGSTSTDTSPELYLRTSGSTGTPKLAVHTHDSLQRNAHNCVERLMLRSDYRVAIPVPIFHMFGLGAAFLPSVAVQASIDLQKGANVLNYMQREKDFNPNIAFMTPAFCETILKVRKSPRTYNMTVVAGDRIRERTFNRYESFFGCLIQLYGSTEMGAASAASPNDPSSERICTAGRPMTGVRFRINSETHDDTGELWCCHEHGFKGYIDISGNPVKGIENGWFCTQDIGRIFSDSRLEILGRSNNSINRDGLIVHLSDIEKALESIQGVEIAVAIAKGETLRGKRIVAYCIPAKGADLSEESLKSSCFSLLQRRAVPDNIIITNTLPMLPSGKIDRQEISKLTDITN